MRDGIRNRKPEIVVYNIIKKVDAEQGKENTVFNQYVVLSDSSEENGAGLLENLQNALGVEKLEARRVCVGGGVMLRLATVPVDKQAELPAHFIITETEKASELSGLFRCSNSIQKRNEPLIRTADDKDCIQLTLP